MLRGGPWSPGASGAMIGAAMKLLTLIRHAKSSWKDAELSDFERPLNARGERDANRAVLVAYQKVDVCNFKTIADQCFSNVHRHLCSPEYVLCVDE